MIAWFSGKKKTNSTSQEKSKDDFVSLSSHELRTPLSIIKWYTEILLDGDAGPLTEDQRKYLTLIESSNQRAIDLIRSLLNVSRLDLGTFSILPEDVSVVSLIKEVICSLEVMASKKSITVEFIEDETVPNLNIDKHITTLVLKHLLSNAISFSKEGQKIFVKGSVGKRGEIVGGKEVGQDSVLVEVVDRGIGIPTSDQPKLFSKMFRASNVKDGDGTGFGLGLYVSKTVVEVVGGDVWFSSEENKGSTFYLALPLSGMKKKEGKTTLD